MKHKYFIDAHKGMTAVYVLALMAVYGIWNSPRLWLYFAVHGSYGVLWILKSYIFPDSQWEKPVPLWYGLVSFFGLALYWVAPWLIVSGHTSEPPPWQCGIGVFVYGVGVFFHFAADMQKHVSLSLRPGVLLTTGLWSRLRNPNYFGELLIYASFGIIANHYSTFVILGLFVASVWIPNMIKKERSLSRYPDFAAWKARSYLMIPGIW